MRRKSTRTAASKQEHEDAASREPGSCATENCSAALRKGARQGQERKGLDTPTRAQTYGPDQGARQHQRQQASAKPGSFATRPQLGDEFGHALLELAFHFRMLACLIPAFALAASAFARETSPQTRLHAPTHIGAHLFAKILPLAQT